jgi:hypothetical protein
VVALNCMKRWLWFVLISIVSVFVCLGLFYPVLERGPLKMRAEVRMLDVIRGGVSAELDSGGQLPTNWMSLSNSVNWDKVLGMCESYHLPPPTETYSVLAQKVTNTAYAHSGGLFFLVRSKPYRSSPKHVGRWALTADPKPIGLGPSRFGIYRVWLPEDAVTPAMSSQLTNQPW